MEYSTGDVVTGICYAAAVIMRIFEGLISDGVIDKVEGLRGYVELSGEVLGMALIMGMAGVLGTVVHQTAVKAFKAEGTARTVISVAVWYALVLAAVWLLYH